MSTTHDAFFMLFADAMALAITGAWPLNMLMPEMPTWTKPRVRRRFRLAATGEL